MTIITIVFRTCTLLFYCEFVQLRFPLSSLHIWSDVYDDQGIRSWPVIYVFWERDVDAVCLKKSYLQFLWSCTCYLETLATALDFCLFWVYRVRFCVSPRSILHSGLIYVWKFNSGAVFFLKTIIQSELDITNSQGSSKSLRYNQPVLYPKLLM